MKRRDADRVSVAASRRAELFAVMRGGVTAVSQKLESQTPDSERFALSALGGRL